MSFWVTFSALLPIIIVVLCILLLKQNIILSSTIGLALTGLLIVFIDAFQITIPQTWEIISSTLVLSVSVVTVIIPGLYFNGIMREQKRIDKISDWMENLPIISEKKALILLVGFLPAVESLTGFGISLFLGVPIFLKLFPSEIALKLSLLGMNIMPWGTLALATITGANLVQQSIKQLGTFTSLTSFIVFPYIALVSLYIIGGSKTFKKHFILALFLGFLLSVLLAVNNYFVSTKTAGILAGMITGLFGIFLAYRGKIHIKVVFNRKTIKTFFPYFLVLILAFFVHFFQPLNNLLASFLVLKSNEMSFSVLTSPGFILLLVALLLQLLNPVQFSLLEVINKSKNACLSITAFLFLSQTMLQSGMIEALSTGLSKLTGEYYSLLLSPLIGMISGFTTSSNVGGNALLIRVQEEIGRHWDRGLLFAAVQNSSAGHMVFSSIPIIILVLTIFKDTISVKNLPVNESNLLKFTLKVSVGVYLAIVMTLTFLYQIELKNILF